MWSTGTKNSATGLTLLETILVMCLMLTLLALVAPQLDRFSRGRVLRCQAERVLRLLQISRDRSAAECEDYRVNVNVNEATCRLLKRSGATFQRTSDLDGRPLELPSGIGVEIESLGDQGERNCVDFRPTGECTPVRITLRNNGDQVFLVCRTPLESFMMTESEEEAGL
jgi:type II secretory pathway pseudopilin PulG